MRVLTKALGCAAALAMLAAVPAQADQWNKKTFLTFSGPVQVPGVTLPAGTYTFKLADLMGNRHVVQIFDKSEKKIYTTILAIPDQRMTPTDKPVVLFSERPAGSPQAVKAWFYPGETIGNEFVYPKSQAIQIAKQTHQTVLATNDTSSDTEHMKSAEIGRVNENGEMTSESGSTTVQTPPTPETRAVVAGTSGTERSARTELPRTASELPLFSLLSGLSFAAAFALRRARQLF